MERKLVGNPIGIRLFGSFLITRQFIFSIISVVFATEMVFLQMASQFRGKGLVAKLAT